MVVPGRRVGQDHALARHEALHDLDRVDGAAAEFDRHAHGGLAVGRELEQRDRGIRLAVRGAARIDHLRQALDLDGAVDRQVGARAARQFADEFDVDGLPDPTRWTYEEGLIRNNELQYYTRERPENARVADGTLIIESRREPWEGADYTSASVTTRGLASWRYGRIEVRAKLPTGRGMWPAIWMLGENIEEVGWPACGEIDIMENVGFDPDRIHGNVHTEAFNHVLGTNLGAAVALPDPHLDFHLYAVEWRSDRIDFFVDGERYFSFENSGEGPAEWPFDTPHFLILNAAVGGGCLQPVVGLVGSVARVGVDDSIFPQRYYIDYVRVYEEVP